jgi:hypothetical protein
VLLNEITGEFQRKNLGGGIVSRLGRSRDYLIGWVDLLGIGQFSSVSQFDDAAGIGILDRYARDT